MPKHTSRFGLALAFAAAIAIGSLAAPSQAEAQAMEETGEQVGSSPKGLIGLGLIGAELGLTIPALAGLDETWSLIVFPAVGFAGGAIAGHYLIDNKDKPKAAVAMLITGLSLVIPSIVITVAATAYDPEGDIEEAESEPESATRQRQRAVASAGSGMIRVHEGGVALTMPGLSVGGVYSAEELVRYGGDQATEVELSLISGSF